MPSILRLLARVRIRLARSPWLYWAVVGVAALVVWLTVIDATSALDHERAQWGATRSVLVTTIDLASGARLVAATRDYPAAMVPATALAPDDPRVVGARVRHDLAVGSILTALDLATDASTAADRAGWVVLAIDPAHQPPLVPGDGVATFAVGRWWCDGTVVEIEPLQIAVPTDCAAAISDQTALGSVTLGRTARP